jgi:hypothetical protein
VPFPKEGSKEVLFAPLQSFSYIVFQQKMFIPDQKEIVFGSIKEMNVYFSMILQQNTLNNIKRLQKKLNNNKKASLVQW